MTKRGYESFCSKYEVDPNNVDAVLWVVDELEGNFGDADGKLEEIREYALNEIYEPSEAEKLSDYDKDYGVAVSVFQVKDGKTRYFAFMPFEFMKKKYGGIDLENYELVATIFVPKDISSNINAVLEYVFNYGNTDNRFYADNPKARSISVSDLLWVDGIYYYVDSFGFTKLNDKTDIIEVDGLQEKKDLLAEEEPNDEELDIDKSEEVEEQDEKDADELEDVEVNKTILDYIQDRIGQQISVGELNAILQSLFARYNQVFLLTSDLYNKDLDETQELVVDDDEDFYIINYDIVDMDEGIIEITDVNVE